MEEISIEEARRTLGDIVDRARLAGQSTVITRHGKPAAMVVPAAAADRSVPADAFTTEKGNG
jgi:prevent-host-death family protein